MSLCWEIQTTIFLKFQSGTTTKRNLSRCVCTKVDPLQNANGKSKVDHHCIRHIERWFERKIDPVLCKGDLDQRSRTHERTSRIPQNLDDGVIDEDLQFTQCALRYVPQAQKTIKLNNMIMERSAKFWKTHTRNPEQIPLLGYPRVPTLFVQSRSVKSMCLMQSVWELHTFEYGLKESPNAVLHHFTQACKPTSATGHAGLAGTNLFDTTRECMTEAH